MFKGLPELIDVCSCVLFHLTSRLMLGIIWGYVDVFLSSFFPLRGGGEPRQRSNQVLSFGGGEVQVRGPIKYCFTGRGVDSNTGHFGHQGSYTVGRLRGQGSYTVGRLCGLDSYTVGRLCGL